MSKFLNVPISASIGLRSYFLFFLLLVAFCNLSCSGTKTKNDSALDSVAIIKSGLEYVFKTNHFAPEFYANPVQIIKSGNVPKETKFIINGRTTKLVNKQSKLFYTKNVFKPMPFADVEKFKIIDTNTVTLDLGFPSIGNVYQLKIYLKNREVLRVEEEGVYQTK